MGAIDPRTVVTDDGVEILSRTVTEDDALELIQFARTALSDTDWYIIQPHELAFTEAEERRWIAAHELDPRSLLVAAISGQQMIGMIEVAGNGLERQAHWGTVGIMVAIEWRGRGVGRALLEEAVRWAEGNPSLEQLRLGVFVDNVRARRFYEGMGFVVEGRRTSSIKYGDGRYTDEFLMVRWTPGPE